MLGPGWLCQPELPPGAILTSRTSRSEVPFVLSRDFQLAVLVLASNCSSLPLASDVDVKPDGGVASTVLPYAAMAMTGTTQSHFSLRCIMRSLLSRSCERLMVRRWVVGVFTAPARRPSATKTDALSRMRGGPLARGHEGRRADAAEADEHEREHPGGADAGVAPVQSFVDLDAHHSDGGRSSGRAAAVDRHGGGAGCGGRERGARRERGEPEAVVGVAAHGPVLGSAV